MTRRELREHCFKMLFCADFYPAEETKQQLEGYFEAPEEDETTPEGEIQILHQVDMEEKDRAYLTEKAGKALDRLVELDARINQVAEGWKTRRMGKVELTILRLALYEILYDEEIPQKVAINEAVELAKKYESDEVVKFINGILGAFLREEVKA